MEQEVEVINTERYSYCMEQCKKCGDIIESAYIHDFETCSCGYCSVDGGHYYLKRWAKSLDDFIDLSEFRE